MTRRRWFTIAGLVIAALLIAGAVWVAVDRIGASQPTAAPSPPPLATPSSSPSPSPSPEATPADPSATPSPSAVDPATIPGAVEAEGIWYVPCESEYADPVEVVDDYCMLAGSDTADPSQAADIATTFMQQWMILDTDEPWDARAARLAPYVSTDFTAPFPELAWEARYDTAGSLTFRALVTDAAVGSTVPQLIGPATYTASFVVEYDVEWTLPSGEVNSQHDFGVWVVTVADGLITEVQEPDLFE